MLLVTLVWLGLASALLVTMVWRWVTYEQLHPGPPPVLEKAPSLTVIVPARNEAANIERCLNGLLAQTYPSQRLTLVVVNDGSTDDTATIVNRIIVSDSRVQMIESGPLPDGWTGKARACWRGAAVAQGEWLCFVDADTSAVPQLLSSAVAYAQAKGIALLSLNPFQELGAFWERLLIPAGFVVVELLMDLSRINNPATPEAAANGQFILIHRQAYEAVEGHAAVRKEILEDVALARTIKKAGYRIKLVGGMELIRTRMYADLKTLWEGLSKNAVDFVPNLPLAMLAGTSLLLLGWLWLVLVLWTGVAIVTHPGLATLLSFGAAMAGTSEIMLLFVLHLKMARLFQIPLWYGLLFPVSLTLGGGIMLSSAWRRTTGRVAWKGRTYDFKRPLLRGDRNR